MGIVCPLDALIVELGLQIIGVWPGVRCSMWHSGLAELLAVWEAWMWFVAVVGGVWAGCCGLGGDGEAGSQETTKLDRRCGIGKAWELGTRHEICKELTLGWNGHTTQ